MLEHLERRQLQEALISAIPSLNKLKQFSRYELGQNLEKIANCGGDLSDIVFDLIEWAISTGQLEKLIDEAWQKNRTNPDLKKFVEEVWKPLRPQQESVALFHQEPETLTQAEVQRSMEALIESQSEPVDINTKRHLKPIHEGREVEVIQESREPPSVSPLVFPLNGITEMRTRIYAAQDYIQDVYTLFQPEREIFRDQCQFAVEQVQAAHESIEKGLAEQMHSLSLHTPARSSLELEQVYFCEEARRTIVYIQEFANLTVSLPLRKKVWDKLQILKKSLEDSHDLLDTLLDRQQEDKVDN